MLSFKFEINFELYILVKKNCWKYRYELVITKSFWFTNIVYSSYINRYNLQTELNYEQDNNMYYAIAIK